MEKIKIKIKNLQYRKICESLAVLMLEEGFLYKKEITKEK